MKARKRIKLVIEAGRIHSIYDDALTAMFPNAEIEIVRASHVEPDSDGHWTADLGPVGGPVLNGFETRQKALDAEARYINRHVIK